MKIQLDFQTDERILLDTSKLYLTISPATIVEKGLDWTTYQLEEYAFGNIPVEFPEDRAEVGKRLESLGENVILHAYGPIEGDYYLEIPKGSGGHEQT